MHPMTEMLFLIEKKIEVRQQFFNSICNSGFFFISN